MPSAFRSQAPEIARIAVLLLAALAVGYPLMTPNLLGGPDARWYAYMLADVRDQLQGRHFPLLVGQGAFAWNGGVHPFRSAPLYMLVAGTWELTTFGHLGIVTLQHLTLLTSLVVGTLGFYAGAGKLWPGRRWVAVAFAALYLASPPWLMVLYAADAHMSAMAFAVFPLVLYGNAYILLKPTQAAHRILAAGLALMWMAHPPIAATTTLTTIFIQGGNLLSDRAFHWRWALGGLLWFGCLSAYYFASMSEIPSLEPPGIVRELVQLGGLGLYFVGLGNAALKRRGLGWALAATTGGLAVALTSRAWLDWIAITTALVLGLEFLSHRTARLDSKRQAFPLLFVGALGGAAITYGLIGSQAPGFSPKHIGTLNENSADLLGYLRPISLPLRLPEIAQLGWALTAGLAVATWAFFTDRAVESKIVLAAVLTQIAFFIRLPYLSDFLAGYFPDHLAALANLSFFLRLTPVMAGFSALAVLLWCRSHVSALVRARWLTGIAVTAALAWAGAQASVFVRWGRQQTGNAAALVRAFRTENVVLDRYAYDLLTLPAYFSNGVTDPRLENRWLDPAPHSPDGPDQTALAMERTGAVRVQLRVHLLPNAPGWFELKPSITLPAGAHRLLRFEFAAGQDYAGVLLANADQGYREYYLPDSGEKRSFGVGQNRNHVISLWNSGDLPQTYGFEMQRAPSNSFRTEGAVFAEVLVSNFDPAQMAVRLESLIPYRAQVTAAEPGTLETFRCYVPGYRALVDGSPTVAFRSPQSLVAVRVPAGSHRIELRYVGTPLLWLTGALSIGAWTAWIWLGWRNLRLSPSTALRKP